ncbi:MAG: hypothetical protein KKD17_03620 [Nanoarchaeota archaeon]|nr:hypothetical protein [Nanoarchaeota archaeon]
MITRNQQDRQKALSLMRMAEITLKRLNESDKQKYPSNTLTDYYDIIHKLMEALAANEGIKVKGEGAHQQLIDHTCERYKLGEQTRQFLQQLREYRNRVSYEGFIVRPEFIETNSEKIETTVNRLTKLLQEGTKRK